MYVLDELTIYNFKCFHETHTISFRGKDIVAIVGQRADADNRSNWCGKSSIGDAIKFLNYKKFDCSRVSNLIHYGEESAYVEGVYRDPDTGETFTIKREVLDNDETILTFEDSTCGKVRNQEEINQLLGISYEDWLMTAYFNQGDVQKFCDKKPSEKRADVQRWISKTYWEKLRKVANQKKLDLTKELDRQRVIAETDYYDCDDLQDKIDARQQELEALRVESEQLVSDVSTYNEMKQKYSDIKQVLRDMHSSMYKDVKSNDIIIHEYDWVSLNAHKEYFEKRVKSYDDWLATISREEKDTKTRYNQLKESGCDFNGVCPVDGNACPRTSEMARSDDVEVLLQECDRLIKASRLEYNKVQVERNIAYSDLTSVVSRMGHAESLIQGCKTTAVSPSGSEWISIYRELREVKEYLRNNASALEVQAKQRELADNINKLSSAIGSLKATREHHLGLEKKVQEAEGKIVELEKNVAAYTFLNYAFGQDGIPAKQVEDALEFVAYYADKYLRRLGTGLGVRFNYKKVLKKKSDVCYNCGEVFLPKAKKCTQCGTTRPYKVSDDLNIEVLSDGNWGEFDLQSGGCKSLVSVMIRFAVSKLLRNNNQMNVSIGWIDEILGMLDPTNRTAVVSEIISGHDLGLRQKFIVTHDQSVQSMFENVLIVERDGDKSKIFWA